MIWCPGPESNRHGRYQPRDFKSLASTNFATRAEDGMEAGAGVEPTYMDLQSSA